MSFIYITGYREPVEVTRVVAQAVDKALNDESISESSVIKTDQWTGRKSQIRSVRITNDYIAPSIRDNFIEETRAYRNKIFSKPIEYRAFSTNFFEMVYWGFTGKLEISDEIRQKVHEMQLKFFRSNPKRLYPDPSIFKELIGDKPCNKHILSVIEQSIRADVSFR